MMGWSSGGEEVEVARKQTLHLCECGGLYRWECTLLNAAFHGHRR